MLSGKYVSNPTVDRLTTYASGIGDPQGGTVLWAILDLNPKYRPELTAQPVSHTAMSRKSQEA